MKMNPLTAIDFYKAGHRQQYPAGTTMVYSNFTARSDKHSNLPIHMRDGHIVFAGLRYFMRHYLIDLFNEEFFSKPKQQVVDVYKRRMDTSLGKDSVPIDHIEALHDLGYVPLRILALPEGTRVPIGVPCLVMHNTHPDFFWMTNYPESVLSCYLWKASTAATTAYAYRRLFDTFADYTGSPFEFVDFQAHDFSFRGLCGIQDAAITGMGHLFSFLGTDNVPAIDLLEQYYLADADMEPIGFSVPATEHSVMCMGTQESEIDTFRRLITETYPKGIVSIVSDTWNFWQVIGDYAKLLKDEIMQREGKVVFRPDSGDPADIICGNPNSTNALESKGAVEVLWEIFGGTITPKGYKLLDPRVGLIYGDSITPAVANDILYRLQQKGFASGNVVLGIGSYTYQHVTRDTYGFAVKSTYGEVNGVGRMIFKDPVTDCGTKRSARGLLHVYANDEGKLTLLDGIMDHDVAEKSGNKLRLAFNNGEILSKDSLSSIRQRLKSGGRA